MTPSPDATTTSAAAAHDELVAAYHAQRERLWPSEDMWSGAASNFKPDLKAPLNEVHKYVVSRLREGDVLLDVGGGAGRMSLPLAGNCREVVCVDPSQGMAKIFESSARDAGIRNARFVLGDWLDADCEGDVALVSHVTYFVPKIGPFLSKLNKAARRQVIVATRSVAPPNQWSVFVEIAKGERQVPVPGAEHVLAVLKEMSIPADLVDLGEGALPARMPIGKTPDEAIKLQADSGLRLGWLKEGDVARFTESVRARFDDLFVLTGDGYRTRATLGVRDLVITWETRR
jgi:2-polyprenyl-3-methyl-5-hydroxy-6-metoxy-1,4-benzoquinol methylase